MYKRQAQRRAFHAVKSSDGTIIGFVMASVFTAHISARHRNILIVHLAIFILMMLVSTFLTHAFIRFLRKSLMGFNPHELLNMYIRQDDVMNSIEEGLIATDTDGKILFSNIVARKMCIRDSTTPRPRVLRPCPFLSQPGCGDPEPSSLFSRPHSCGVSF